MRAADSLNRGDFPRSNHINTFLAVNVFPRLRLTQAVRTPERHSREPPNSARRFAGGSFE
jgi:hypothetical protein